MKDLIANIQLNNALKEKAVTLINKVLDNDETRSDEEFTLLYKDMTALFRTLNGVPFSTQSFEECWDEHFKQYNVTDFKDYCLKYDMIPAYDLSKETPPQDAYLHCFYISKFLYEEQLLVMQQLLNLDLVSLVIPSTNPKEVDKIAE